MAHAKHSDITSTVAAAALSGSAASAASSAVLALAGSVENDSAAAPTNATSHWLWGREAYRKNGFSLRHTLAGYAIHHSMSVFWALVYEAVLGPQRLKPVGSVVGNAVLVSAAACLIDYTVTPKRLTPGFEARLSRKSMALVYAAFAAGLAAATLARRR
jgi:hypothetical protein